MKNYMSNYLTVGNEMKRIESNNIHRVYIQHNNANMWKGVTYIYK